MSLGTQIKLTVLSLVVASTVFGQKPPTDAKPEEVEKELVPFVNQLKDKDAKIRLKAVADLAAKGEAAATAATALCDAIMDTSPRVGEAALVSIEKVRPDLYPSLSKIVLDRDRTKQFVAVADLGLLAEKALPTKKLLLSRLRAETITLKRIGYDGGLDRLIGGVDAVRDDSAVLVLMNAIAQMDPDNADVQKVRKMLAGVGNKVAVSRLEAIDALIRWAGEEEMRKKEVLPIVGVALQDRELQIPAMGRLASFGGLAKGYLPTLKKLKLSPDEATRNAANTAVDAIEGK